MSFSTDCKQELMEQEPYSGCCAASHLYGFLCFFASPGPRELSFNCEMTEILHYIKDRFADYGIELPEDSIATGKKISSLRVNDALICEQVYNDFGFADDAPRLRIHSDFLLCSDCARAFAAGAFLAAGTLTEPTKGYHLEFATHRTRIAEDLCALLQEQGFKPKMGKRGYDTIVYFKDSSQIEDLLAFMGAGFGSMQLMEAKIYKDVRNQVTRRVNCDSANMKKAVAAATQDVQLFTALMQAGGDAVLGEELLALAKLRIERPDLSMSDLAETLNTGITKSGVSHRLRRIREIAEKYLDERN